jgi:uncharacterized glyoxalase superfamily protein PhnB
MTDALICKLRKISPIFIVDSIPDTIDYYVKRLGFEILYQADGENGDPFFAMLSRDDNSIMFKKIAPGVHPRSISQYAVKDTAIFDAFWHVDNAAQLFEHIRNKGVKIVRELHDTDYGTKEFAFEDLNGYQFLCGD